MAQTSTYLTFERGCEDAFAFYKQAFGADYAWPITRYGVMPAEDGTPGLSPQVQNLVMNKALPIMGGQVFQPLHEAFWGDYYGEFKDTFGISWMIVCSSKE